MSSPSSVLSVGFGSWGSVGLVLTLGLGGSSATPTQVYGPSFVVAVECSTPGAKTLEAYIPGAKRVEAFTFSAVAVEAVPR